MLFAENHVLCRVMLLRLPGDAFGKVHRDLTIFEQKCMHSKVHPNALEMHASCSVIISGHDACTAPEMHMHLGCIGVMQSGCISDASGLRRFQEKCSAFEVQCIPGCMHAVHPKVHRDACIAV